MAGVAQAGSLIVNRLHVTDPFLWARSPGTDFWIMAANIVAVAGTFPDDLADYEWTTTSLGLTAGSAADFITSADVGAPRTFLTNAAGDLLQSPVVFGDYAHALLAKQFLGYLPTKLNMEAYAAFSVGTSNETASCLGFVEDGGSIVTANDALATVFSDGTNFKLRSGAATSGAGALIDTNYHLWKIVVDATNCTLTMDGANSISVATEADEFPVSFGLGCVAAGNNRIQLAWAHIWYD